MILSAEQREQITRILKNDDRGQSTEFAPQVTLPKGKQDRIVVQNEINEIILDYSLKNNKPELLSQLTEIPEGTLKELFSRILQQYIISRNPRWFAELLELSEKIERKSEQSELISLIVYDLISNGVVKSDTSLIKLGLNTLNKITFRKYRSDTITDILPDIIHLANTLNDEALLFQGHNLILDITDISKRAVLHSDLVQALAVISINKNDLQLYLESIQRAATIHQKLRRQHCIADIINKGASSVFGKKILEIQIFIQHFEDQSEEIRIEVVDSITEQMLDRLKNKELIINNLHHLCERMPFVSGAILQCLLKKAEKSADPEYLSDSMKFLIYLPDFKAYPVKDIIHTGIAIVRQTKSTKCFFELVPFIDKTCNGGDLKKIYLQFTQITLSNGDFENAIKFFGKIKQPSEISTQYRDCLAQLIQEGIYRDHPVFIDDLDLEQTEVNLVFTATTKAIKDISNTASFPQIINHIDSIKQILFRNPDGDQLLLDIISSLISRDFLEVWDSTLLVGLAKLIKDQSIREHALSTIVMKIAEVGVKTRNRDFLQRAVGITCLIDGQNTRSTTLSHIIDNAAILAAQQGDLDLLLRMHSWSGSLLDNGVVPYATKNIIEGMIRYATDNQSLEALEEAYPIVKEIEDPSLRMQLCERLAECFVRIGCSRITNMTPQTYNTHVDFLLEPFEKGLDLLKHEMKKPQVSLKIAGMIDIILSSAKKSNSSGYILPLARFSIEIENPLERNAMMMRIVTNIQEDIPHPDSADPYEIIAYILQNNYHVNTTPTVIDLIYRILDQTTDPFVKLNELCNLADSAIRINDRKLAYSILEETFKAASKLSAEYQQIVIFANLAREFRHIDHHMAKISLDAGLKRLSAVEGAWNAVARHHMVLAIVSMKGILPEEERAVLILQVLEKINDPKQYINALISAYAIVREDKKQCKSIIYYIVKAVEKIESPYDRAFVILDVIPLAVRSSDDETPIHLIQTAEDLSKTINIQHIADTIRDNIAGVLVDLSKKQQQTHFLKKAVEILMEIDDDELKLYRLEQIGYQQDSATSPYIKIVQAATNIVQNGSTPGQVMALERTIRAVTDRGKKTQYFCKLAILFRDNGDLKTSKRMLNNAIKESSIIRPLSKRAYVRCDMAMKMYAAGYENIAQDLVDYAMDAATNIRQSLLRDNVFNELGRAIRIMQGVHE